jgi:hypothetical protein
MNYSKNFINLIIVLNILNLMIDLYKILLKNMKHLHIIFKVIKLLHLCNQLQWTSYFINA